MTEKNLCKKLYSSILQADNPDFPQGKSYSLDEFSDEDILDTLVILDPNELNFDDVKAFLITRLVSCSAIYNIEKLQKFNIIIYFCDPKTVFDIPFYRIYWKNHLIGTCGCPPFINFIIDHFWSFHGAHHSYQYHRAVSKARRNIYKEIRTKI